MRDILRHRGPDDAGLYIDGNVGLGHRRLSIVDVSGGHQPMTNETGKIVIVYNGEIYNHADFREDLERRGHVYRTHCDTETIIHLYEEHGYEVVQHLRGMFAFAIYDEDRRELLLARDRLGVKPLYYRHAPDGSLYFASEIKALVIPGLVEPKLNYDALPDFLANHAPSGDRTMFEGIFRLPPGHTLLWRDGRITLRRYWSLPLEQEPEGRARRDEDYVEEWSALFRQSVRLRLMADVPLGSFLSGGIDSSAITAEMSAAVDAPVKTFSVAFAEREANEFVYARLVSERFATDHHEVTVTPQAFFERLPDLVWHEDEPLAHPSSVALNFVSELAARHVKVVLTGEGSDEMLGGYDRYRAIGQLWRNLDRLPRPARQAAGAALNSVPPALWNGLIALDPSGRRPAHFGHRLRKYFAAMRDADGFGDVIASFLNEWPDGSPIASAGPLPLTAGFDGRLPAIEEVGQMMYADAVSYLPDDILCKVDRAAMAVGLETRVPFLDHRLAELAARIPPALRIDGATGKAVLRDVLFRHVPRKLFNRPKAGFAVPVGEWLRCDLRDWAEDLLAPSNLTAAGYFDPAVVGPRWADHLSGRRDSTQAIWSVLMFQAWFRAKSKIQDASG